MDNKPMSNTENKMQVLSDKFDRLIVENTKTGEVYATVTYDDIETASDEIVVRLRPAYD